MKSKFNKLLSLLTIMTLLLYTNPPIPAEATGNYNVVTWSNPGFYTYTLPKTGVWEIEVWGGKGGDDDATGGPGSYRSGFFRLEKGTTIMICCGAAGATGGGCPRNDIGGGGNTGGHGWSGQGGGASYVTTGTAQQLSSYGYGNDQILIVAGGGGGGTCGVSGGGADVGAGGGGMGYGTNCPSEDGGGGGGGYTGGCGANDGHQTTGGTSYVNENRGSVGTRSNACNWGNGKVTISMHGFSLVFDKNTPSTTENTVVGTMTDQFLIPGIPENLYKNNYKLRGYIFEGWTANADGSGTFYEDEAFIVGDDL